MLYVASLSPYTTAIRVICAGISSAKLLRRFSQPNNYKGKDWENKGKEMKRKCFISGIKSQKVPISHFEFISNLIDTLLKIWL